MAVCTMLSSPPLCEQVAEAHTDEVWHIAFSHNGTMLASASKVSWEASAQLGRPRFQYSYTNLYSLLR